MAVKISKQKTASAANESKKTADESKKTDSATASSDTGTTGTKFAKGKKVSGDAKTAKPKSEKKEKRHAAFTERIEYSASLCLTQKLTDEDIIAKVTEKFPDAGTVFNQKEVGRTRWMLRHDMLPNVHADGQCFDRCFLIEGKIVPRADKPKTAHAKRKAKYSAESDPLNTLGGINVHETTGETVKKPVKKSKKAKTETTDSATE